MKRSRRACPYCKSPAPGNPCWYFLDHPDANPGGGDPPCMLYSDDAVDRLYVRDAAERAAARRARYLIIAAICLSLAILVFVIVRWKMG